MQRSNTLLRRTWLLTSIAALGRANTQRIETYRKEHVLGTSLELQVVGDGVKAFQACLVEVERLRSILSTYDKSSAISNWQRQGETGPVSEDLQDLLRLYSQWEHRTGGAISSSFSGKRDVNALGKSFIVEKALNAAMNAAPNVKSMLLNIGGDIAVRGGSWQIGISDPAQWHENAPLLSRLELKSGAVTTSGSYERGASHLIDPRSGQLAQGASCATVVAGDAVTANALSTALCVLDEAEGRRLIEATSGASCLVVRPSGRTWQSSGFAAQPVLRRIAAFSWPKEQQLTITLTLKTIEGYRVRRPYVAVWAEDLNGKVVRNITVWTEKRRWLPDLFEWWKKTGGNGGGASVTRATRPPGRYQLIWDGLDDSGQPVPAGKYRIFVETNREHGSYAKESGVIECGAVPAKVMLKENGEFEAVELSYGAGGQAA